MNRKRTDFNFFSHSFNNKLFEWVSDKEVASCRIAILTFGFNHVYPELHNNQELIDCDGVDLYMFEATGSRIDNARKLLYHFYKLCELIFQTIKREVNENTQVDLFYNEMLSECIPVSVKFCNDIKPCESDQFCNFVKNTVAKVYNDPFISKFLTGMCGREIDKNFCIKFRIPRLYSKWANDRGYRKDYGGFACYF